MRCDVSDEKQVAACMKAVEDGYQPHRCPAQYCRRGSGQTLRTDHLGGIFPHGECQLGRHLPDVQIYPAHDEAAAERCHCQHGIRLGHVGQTGTCDVWRNQKARLSPMSRALAWELAPYHIRVNTVSPGSVDTPMLRSDIDLESRRTGLPFETVKKEREQEQAFQRWADPAEIAEPIYFLASEGASFVTGADWLVDCGWVAK